MERILFFDTETTGVPLNYSLPPTVVDNWPRVVQLGFALYTEEGELLECYNMVIRPDGWSISPEAEKVHGISLSRAEMEGIAIADALQIFADAIAKADLLVAHNLNFDYNVLAAEFIRAKKSAQKKPKMCTMLNTTSLLKLPGKRVGSYKWPKLEELHRWLFNGQTFDGAHDALSDVLATAKCYFELHRKGILIIPIEP